MGDQMATVAVGKLTLAVVVVFSHVPSILALTPRLYSFTFLYLGCTSSSGKCAKWQSSRVFISLEVALLRRFLFKVHSPATIGSQTLLNKKVSSVSFL